MPKRRLAAAIVRGREVFALYPPHLARDLGIDRPIGYLGNPRNCWGFGLPG